MSVRTLSPHSSSSDLTVMLYPGTAPRPWWPLVGDDRVYLELDQPLQIDEA